MTQKYDTSDTPIPVPVWKDEKQMEMIEKFIRVKDNSSYLAFLEKLSGGRGPWTPTVEEFNQWEQTLQN
jgi:hypothetical protein